MAYKALTYMNLPPDNRKAPGDTITDKELKDAGQTDVHIQHLIKTKAMGKESDPIDEAHAPVTVATSTTADVNIITGEVGTGGE
jgi:hypothetical protein